MVPKNRLNSSITYKRINKITLGTKEWSDYSVNCFNGCSNDCRYCYAKKMSIRFGRKTEKSWKIMEVRGKELKKNYKKRSGRFMFPTAHDITADPEVLNACLLVLKNLLKSGNNVLITSKPNFDVIKRICDCFNEYLNIIQFRFTITTDNDKLISFWEPAAPSFAERLKSLKYAIKKGYKTSVSIEPFLSDPNSFVMKLEPYISESIWIGPMNYIQKNGILDEDKKYFRNIRKLVNPKNLYNIYKKLNELNIQKIRFKDSFLIKLFNAKLIDKID